MERTGFHRCFRGKQVSIFLGVSAVTPPCVGKPPGGSRSPTEGGPPRQRQSVGSAAGHGGRTGASAGPSPGRAAPATEQERRGHRAADRPPRGKGAGTARGAPPLQGLISFFLVPARKVQLTPARCTSNVGCARVPRGCSLTGGGGLGPGREQVPAGALSVRSRARCAAGSGPPSGRRCAHAPVLRGHVRALRGAPRGESLLLTWGTAGCCPAPVRADSTRGFGCRRRRRGCRRREVRRRRRGPAPAAH